MAEKLTKKQTEVLQFIKNYVVKYGYAPTVREICSGLNLSSPATVHSHLAQLQKKGMITKGVGKFRTIEVLCENEYAAKKTDIIKVPTINSNKSEKLDELIDKSRKLFAIPTSIVDGLNKKDIFALNIENNSFNDLNIFKGDTLIINKESELVENNLVIYSNKNDNILKICLYLNDDIKWKDKKVNIIGKVVSLYRKY